MKALNSKTVPFIISPFIGLCRQAVLGRRVHTEGHGLNKWVEHKARENQLLATTRGQHPLKLTFPINKEHTLTIALLALV